MLNNLDQYCVTRYKFRASLSSFRQVSLAKSCSGPFDTLNAIRFVWNLVKKSIMILAGKGM